MSENAEENNTIEGIFYDFTYKVHDMKESLVLNHVD